ncbi:hypothetical protein ZWY2020_009558 [Hordeum vulgare]|nr:hypothetical protein ZWY2020_009558 [Hordeum vulgare]
MLHCNAKMFHFSADVKVVVLHHSTSAATSCFTAVPPPRGDGPSQHQLSSHLHRSTRWASVKLHWSVNTDTAVLQRNAHDAPAAPLQQYPVGKRPGLLHGCGIRAAGVQKSNSSLSKMPNPEKKLFRMPSADAEIAALHKEWDDARCPICMDHPHNAVLVLCSSHDKGCRSYISNRMDSSSHPSSSLPGDTSNQRSPRLLIDVPEFRENLSHEHVIRSSATVSGQQEGTNYNQGPVTLEALMGQVKAGRSSKMPDSTWTRSQEAARGKHACAFSGTYGALRRHARRVHPTTRPADVDPSRRRAWHRLENQREYGDIMSATSGPLRRDEPRGSSIKGPEKAEASLSVGRELAYDDDDDDEDEDSLEEEVQRPRTRRRFVRSRSEEPWAGDHAAALGDMLLQSNA